MKIAACACMFKRTSAGLWEEGIAITTEHGVSDVIVIVSNDQRERAHLVHDYRLDWTHNLDLRGIPSLTIQLVSGGNQGDEHGNVEG